MKEQLRSYMEQHGMTQQQVANAIGKSVTTINQYLKGAYKGKVEEVDQAIERLITRQKDKVVERRFKSDFVNTHAAELCLDTIYIAHTEGDIVVITGAAGLGKTQALKHYHDKNPETIFIEVVPSFTPTNLLKEISKQLGLTQNVGNHELFTLVTEKMGKDRLILIDEAELLSTKSLEYMRRIHDATRCGIVLTGMPRLLLNLKGKRGELAQLYSRVGFHCDLKNALPKEDIGLLAEKGLGTDEFNEQLFEVSKGNARRLNKLMRGVIRLAEMHNRPIDSNLINRYAEMLIS